MSCPIGLCNKFTGAPSFALLRRVGYYAFDLRTLEPHRHIALRFVVPTLRKKREGWGTRKFVAEPDLDKSEIT
jgi:hypothetical protein